jgi:hypothetical protein
VSESVRDELLKKLPYFDEITGNIAEKKHLESYFTQIRDALAQKTDGNFNYDKEDVSNDIINITLKTNELTPKLTLTLGELEKLFEALDTAIKTDPEHKKDYEDEELKFSIIYSKGNA